MPPRTQNPTPPSTMEHVCQAAETGRWSLVTQALLSANPTVHMEYGVSSDHEKRLVDLAIQQDQWDFVKDYISRGFFIVSEDILGTVALKATEKGFHDFVAESIFCFGRQDIDYNESWFVKLVGLFLKDLHLEGAIKLAKSLPRKIHGEVWQDTIILVECLETTHQEQKDTLLGEFYRRLVADSDSSHTFSSESETSEDDRRGRDM